jgi:hypothetical protein
MDLIIELDSSKTSNSWVSCKIPKNKKTPLRSKRHHGASIGIAGCEAPEQSHRKTLLQKPRRKWKNRAMPDRLLPIV